MGSGSSSGGNNSEDSALVSIGNPFGLNFDSDSNHAGQNSEQNSEDDGGDKEPPAGDVSSKPSSLKPPPSTSLVAEAASLKAMAASSYPSTETARDANNELKRKAPSDDESDGYDSDEEQGGVKASTSCASSEGSRKKGKKGKGDNKRKERNAREKERSFRIAKKINELRELLSTGGVIVPKGTKSSVLTEAASYIRTLQQHQYRAEMYVLEYCVLCSFLPCVPLLSRFVILYSDRQQLIQQMQMIGGGAHGPQAAAAIRQLAAQNGVWSLGNFGGVPPKPAPAMYPSEPKSSDAGFLQANQLEPLDYRFFFNSCGIGMVSVVFFW